MPCVGSDLEQQELVHCGGDINQYNHSGKQFGIIQQNCLENLMDRGAWRATVHGVARVGHDLATKPQWNRRCTYLQPDSVTPECILQKVFCKSTRLCVQVIHSCLIYNRQKPRKKKSRCPLTAEQCYSHMMENYSAIKMNKLQLYVSNLDSCH